MTQKDDATPADMAAAREAGETLASIAARTGLTPSAVRRRAQAGGFLAATRTHWDGYDPILIRLVAALDRKMRIVEQRIAGNDGMSRMDSERDARTLNGLARLYDRLTEMAGRVTGKSAERSGGRHAGEGDDETERLRRELADRLERLRRQTGG